MKKLLTSLALALLAVFSVLPCAYAEEFVPLGSYTAGDNLNCYISNVDTGAQVVSLDLPMGCTLVDDFSGSHPPSPSRRRCDRSRRIRFLYPGQRR